MARLVLLPIILLLACGDNKTPGPTVGDQAEVILTAFCEDLADCGVELSVDECIEWNLDNICSTRTDCTVDATGGQQDDLDDCLDYFEDHACSGVVDESCLTALGIE